MAYRLFFQVEGLPKSINAMGRAHWAVKAKEARAWKNIVHLATCGKRPPEPLKSAHIVLTRHSSKPMDFDNLAISFKHVLDGLIDSLVIYDDSPEYVDVEYAWEKAPQKAGRISILIEEK